MFLENGYLDINISIPAFREEGDIPYSTEELLYIDFNPRLP